MPSNSPRRRAPQSAAEIIAGFKARLVGKTPEQQRKLKAWFDRTNEGRWARQQEAFAREQKAIERQARTTSNAQAHWQTKQNIAEAVASKLKSERMPALPVVLCSAAVDGVMAPTAYALGLWAVARAPALRPGVETDGFGTYQIEADAFDLDADFNAPEGRSLSRIRETLREATAQWQAAKIMLPSGAVPLVESMEVVRSGPGHAIRFKLPEAIDVLATAREYNEHRTHPYCRYLPAAAAAMTALPTQRLYLWISSRRWGSRRYWNVTPDELCAALSLPHGTRAAHIERAIDRAVESLPVSWTLRLQWSPIMEGNAIGAYEFQLVPLYQDIRRWVWRREAVTAREDEKTLWKSMKAQIARYHRNVERVEDKDAFFRKFIGDPHADHRKRRYFEGLLPTLVGDSARRCRNTGGPEVKLLRELDAFDKPRMKNEAYVPIGADSLGNRRYELRQPALAEWGISL